MNVENTGGSSFVSASGNVPKKIRDAVSYLNNIKPSYASACMLAKSECAGNIQRIEN